MESFINSYSYKCLLGPQSKDIEVIGNLAKWRVNKKIHFSNLGIFDNSDILYLKNFDEINFHYLSPENFEILKPHFKIFKGKLESTCINMENLTYDGRANHGIRGAINKNKKLPLIIKDNFDSFEDIKVMLDDWSENIGAKYFRDFSGKNKFFFKNNFHSDCHNTFIYDADKLIAFASLSPGEYSSYIIGKALFHKYPGLSEYTDAMVYERAKEKGVKTVNLGQSKGNIAKYKNKFPNSYTINHFDGSMEKQ